MLSIFVGIVADVAILFVTAFVLSKIAERLSNRAFRFFLFFVAFIPVNLAINYVNVRARGYHQMGWIGDLIISAVAATWVTFWGPQPRTTNAP